MQALVSIIIPTYNRAHLIGETLDSVMAQTYKNWECIVVDDGSIDYTDELLEFYCEKDDRIQYYHRPKDRPKGANACRNYGFELSEGEFVNWFDSDDLMHPEKLKIQLKALEGSKYNFCVCQTMVFQNSIENVLGLKNELIISDDPFYDYLRMKIGWLTQAPLWKKDFLDGLGYLFDEELQAAQEWEFHLRILKKYPEYYTSKDSLVYLRKHPNSITYNSFEKQRFWNYFQARLKVYKYHNLNRNEEINQFLQNYLLNSFKKMTVTRNPNILKGYWSYVLMENKMFGTTKIYAFAAILSYLIFNKGNFFLQKIKYYK